MSPASTFEIVYIKQRLFVNNLKLRYDGNSHENLPVYVKIVTVALRQNAPALESAVGGFVPGPCKGLHPLVWTIQAIGRFTVLASITIATIS
jgi:hypothetical protein